MALQSFDSVEAVMTFFKPENLKEGQTTLMGFFYLIHIWFLKDFSYIPGLFILRVLLEDTLWDIENPDRSETIIWCR